MNYPWKKFKRAIEQACMFVMYGICLYIFVVTMIVYWYLFLIIFGLIIISVLLEPK